MLVCLNNLKNVEKLWSNLYVCMYVCELTPFIAVTNLLPILCFFLLIKFLAVLWPRNFHNHHQEVHIQLAFRHLAKQNLLYDLHLSGN